MESDIRYYRRRANEELAAADRAVTAAARERRLQLAGLFLERLGELQAMPDHPAFQWQTGQAAEAIPVPAA